MNFPPLILLRDPGGQDVDREEEAHPQTISKSNTLLFSPSDDVTVTYEPPSIGVNLAVLVIKPFQRSRYNQREGW